MQGVEPGQATLQVPQWFALVVVDTQAPSHGARPSGQSVWQKPSTHDWPAGHAALQAPQCRALLSVSAHSRPAGVSQTEKAQAAVQAPPLQNSPGAHATPHPPQLARSLAPATQVAPHTSSPAGQSRVHWPALQNNPWGQTRPHWPQ
jgi:hypothetical protein